MEIIRLHSAQELELAFPVIKELRPHLTFDHFMGLVLESRERDDYTLVGILSENKCVAAMGYRTLYDLVHGKHIYVDDLVVTESMRSKGLGEVLLKHAEGIAQEEGCNNLRLCTGMENVSGMKFYERCGWTKKSFAFKKKI